jgi:hypothetical protein
MAFGRLPQQAVIKPSNKLKSLYGIKINNKSYAKIFCKYINYFSYCSNNDSASGSSSSGL